MRKRPGVIATLVYKIIFIFSLVALVSSFFSLLLTTYKDNNIGFPLFYMIFGGTITNVVDNITYTYTFALNIVLVVIVVIKIFSTLFLLILKKKGLINLVLFIVMLLVNIATSVIIIASPFLTSFFNFGIDISNLKPALGFYIYVIIGSLSYILLAISYFRVWRVI